MMDLYNNKAGIVLILVLHPRKLGHKAGCVKMFVSGKK